MINLKETQKILDKFDKRNNINQKIKLRNKATEEINVTARFVTRKI
jgi:hypothetical protein